MELNVLLFLEQAQLPPESISRDFAQVLSCLECFSFHFPVPFLTVLFKVVSLLVPWNSICFFHSSYQGVRVRVCIKRFLCV